jgi:cyclopropane fatty-acyl-phospholipid synthase-like methyltransferase
MDSAKIKNFWDAQAQKSKYLKLEGVANLEENPELLSKKIEAEKDKIMKIVNLDSSMRVLDLGSGAGQWSFRFAKHVNRVVAVEYSQDMCNLALNEAKKSGINNIEFVNISAQDYRTNMKFDLIFISGLLIYLNDKECNILLSQCVRYLKHGGRLVLRDGTGVNSRYDINDRYSETLDAYYSATYRTIEQYISLFESKGLLVIQHEDMFLQGSPLNKWKETRLRIYEFKKNKVF